MPGGPVRLRVSTAYPWEDARRSPSTCRARWTLALRVPGWCAGREADASTASRVAVSSRRRRLRPRAARVAAGDEVVLELPMPPRVLAAHPRVDAVRGCVASARGPIVYCLEQPDQPAGVALEDLRVGSQSPPTAVAGAGIPGVPVILVGQGYVDRADGRGLYAEEAPTPADGEAIEVTAIPYFRWANRGPAPMRVWIPAS